MNCIIIWSELYECYDAYVDDGFRIFRRRSIKSVQSAIRRFKFREVPLNSCAGQAILRNIKQRIDSP